MQEAAPKVEQLAVSIPQAAQMLSVSVRTVQNLVAAKELVSRKIGKRRVIPMTALQGFLRSDHGTKKPN